MKVILLVSISLIFSFSAIAADRPIQGLRTEGTESPVAAGTFAPEVRAETSALEQDTTLSIQDPPEAPLFKASTFSLSNSDRMLHLDNRIGLGISRPGFVQWYGIDVIDWNDKAEWLHFTNRKTFASFDLRLHPKFMLSNSIGHGHLLLHNFFGRTYDQSRNLDLWRSKAIFTPIPHTEIRVEGSNDYSYVGWSYEGQSQIMKMESVFTEVESFTIERWQFKSHLKEAFYEDKNRQRIFENLVLFEAVRAPFNLKIGASGGYNQYQNQMPNYWSPEHFENYGARVNMAKDFTPEWWSELKLYHGLHKDRYSTHKHESAAELSLQFRKRSGLLAKLLVNSFDTEAGLWWRNDVGLNLEVPF